MSAIAAVFWHRALWELAMLAGKFLRPHEFALPVQLSAFQRHQRALCKAARSVAQISMNEAADEQDNGQA